MAILKAPPNMHAVSERGYTFTADEHGFIDTGDAPQSVVDRLLAIGQFGRFTVATAAELDAVADVKTDLSARDLLRAELEAFGVTYDKRLGVGQLTVLLDGVKRKLKAEAAAVAKSQADAAAAMAAHQAKVDAEAKEKADAAAADAAHQAADEARAEDAAKNEAAKT